MLKYFILLFLIPIIIVGLSLTIIFYHSPAVPQTTIFGTSGTIQYSASTISPDGRPVFIIVIDNLNSLISSYKGLSSETYVYALRITNRIMMPMFPSIENVKLIVFGSNTPIPSYSGSVEWSIASKVISFIESNKYAEIPTGSSIDIDLDKIKTTYTYTAVIVYFKRDTAVDNATITYRSIVHSHIPLADAIREELRGNYTMSTILSEIRKSVLYDLFDINNGVVISIISKIVLSWRIIMRWLIAFVLVMIPLIYDYKKNPENYELINRIIHRLKSSRK